MNQLLQEQYERLGISPEVSAFGEKIEASLTVSYTHLDVYKRQQRERHH